MSLGQLERGVMDVLWDAPDEDFSVREVADHFPDHAYTTIMTVLNRLAKKGFVIESKDERAHRFTATATREAYMTTLMHDALSTAPDRKAVLASFAGSLSQGDVDWLRRLLNKRQRP